MEFRPRELPRITWGRSGGLANTDWVSNVAVKRSNAVDTAWPKGRATPRRSSGGRRLVEARGARWFILFARYGLIGPDDEVAPYDFSLKADMRNDGDLLELLGQWAPDEEKRRKILVDNPARLYTAGGLGLTSHTV